MNLTRTTLGGSAASLGAASGTVRIFPAGKPDRTIEFNEGDIIVTTMTNPDFVPLMKLAGAIVTDSGGRTCHAAIVSREFGVPCIVGTQNATTLLIAGSRVRVVVNMDETSVYTEEE